jgi:hypothetical protein
VVLMDVLIVFWMSFGCDFGFCCDLWFSLFICNECYLFVFDFALSCREASILRIDDTFRIMANHVFFRDVWADKSLDEDVKYAMDFVRELALENEQNNKETK